MRVGYILVEGYTEEPFVKQVLNPYLEDRGLWLECTIINTKVVQNGPNFKGGVKAYAQVHKDLRRLVNNTGGQLVTTLFDYYAFPADAPGMNDRPEGAATAVKVQHVERGIHAYYEFPRNLLPFLALHELEAWLFAQPDAVAHVKGAPERAALLKGIRSAVASPEAINDTPEGAPSKRLLALFPGNDGYDKYNKRIDGPAALERIGLDTVRSECLHFDTWLKQLERFGEHGSLA